MLQFQPQLSCKVTCCFAWDSSLSNSPMCLRVRASLICDESVLVVASSPIEMLHLGCKYTPMQNMVARKTGTNAQNTTHPGRKSASKLGFPTAQMQIEIETQMHSASIALLTSLRNGLSHIWMQSDTRRMIPIARY